MNDQSSFNVTVDGKAISVPLTKARELCPIEVNAVELAWKYVSESVENNDTQAMVAASEEVQQRMTALLHALVIKLQEQKTKQV